MQEIKAYIKPHKLTDVILALHRIEGLTGGKYLGRARLRPRARRAGANTDHPGYADLRPAPSGRDEYRKIKRHFSAGPSVSQPLKTSFGLPSVSGTPRLLAAATRRKAQRGNERFGQTAQEGVGLGLRGFPGSRALRPPVEAAEGESSRYACGPSMPEWYGQVSCRYERSSLSWQHAASAAATCVLNNS
jgi:hypothetical protein